MKRSGANCSKSRVGEGVLGDGVDGDVGDVGDDGGMYREGVSIFFEGCWDGVACVFGSVLSGVLGYLRL